MASQQNPNGNPGGVVIEQRSPAANSLMTRAEDYLLSNQTSMTTLRNVESRELLPRHTTSAEKQNIKQPVGIHGDQPNPINKETKVFTIPQMDEMPIKLPKSGSENNGMSHVAEGGFAGGDLRNEKRPLSAMASFLERGDCDNSALPRVFDIRSQSVSRLNPPPQLKGTEDKQRPSSALPQHRQPLTSEVRPKTETSRSNINPVRARPVASGGGKKPLPVSKTISAGNIQVGRRQAGNKDTTSTINVVPIQRSRSSFDNPSFNDRNQAKTTNL